MNRMMLVLINGCNVDVRGAGHLPRGEPCGQMLYVHMHFILCMLKLLPRFLCRDPPRVIAHVKKHVWLGAHAHRCTKCSVAYYLDQDTCKPCKDKIPHCYDRDNTVCPEGTTVNSDIFTDTSKQYIR